MFFFWWFLGASVEKSWVGFGSRVWFFARGFRGSCMERAIEGEEEEKKKEINISP